MKKLISVLVTGAVLLSATILPGVKAQVSAEAAETLFINEIMAANTATIRDGDVEDTKYGTQGGAYSDWVEIYNASGQTVDLTGYTISDDGATWTFTKGVVPAKGFLLVWASDKNKVAADGQVHTNFKLSSSGETVTLKKPDGSTVDSVKFPVLADDQSYGRTADGGAEFSVIAKATPGRNNGAAVPAANEWKSGTTYQVGDVVSYGGKYYKCIFAHTSNDAWIPSTSITLWTITEIISTPTPTATPIPPNTATPNSGYKISGYVKPDFSFTDKSLNAGFKVEIVENGKSAITDSNGYFEIIGVPGQSSCTLKISKNSYLTREIKNLTVTSDVLLGSEASPISIWAGDIEKDNAINMTDIMQIINYFNTVAGDGKYNINADLNLDGAVNMEDIVILIAYFNKGIADYPDIVPGKPTTTPTTPTPIVTPTPTNTEDAWKNNTGTINLGTTITYTGIGISVSGSVVNITAGGDHTVTGTLTNGMILINTKEKVKLRLSGASITNTTGPAIYFQNADKAFITLTENTTNTLIDGRTYSDAAAKGALFSNDSLEIKGAGTLNVTGNFEHAIVSDDDVVVENGNINVKSALKDGIHANNNVTINGGTLNITATKDAIESEGDIIINNGTITISSGDDAMHSALDLTIHGGTINVTNCFEGIESKNILTVNDGKINVVANEDGFNAAKQLILNGGNISVSAKKDGLDSNGAMHINGGYTVVYGGSAPEGGTDCDSNTFAIKGGTLIGMGGNTSGPTASACTQCSVVLSGASANAIVSIKKADGTEILNFTPAKTYATMLFTSPLLTLNTTYNLYINGTLSRTFTTSTMVTKAGGTIFNPPM